MKRSSSFQPNPSTRRDPTELQLPLVLIRWFERMCMRNECGELWRGWKDKVVEGGCNEGKEGRKSSCSTRYTVLDYDVTTVLYTHWSVHHPIIIIIIITFPGLDSVVYLHCMRGTSCVLYSSITTSLTMGATVANYDLMESAYRGRGRWCFMTGMNCICMILSWLG